MIQLSDEKLQFVEGGSKIPYIVKPGDTLGDLAKKFHCEVSDICKWNNIKDPNKIEVDQKLFFLF